MNLRQDVFDSIEECHSPSSTDHILAECPPREERKPNKQDAYLTNVIEIANTGDVSKFNFDLDFNLIDLLVLYYIVFV